MTSFPENKLVEFEEVPASAPVEAAIQTQEIDIRQMSDKGYDFIRDGSAAFTGEIFGSVAGRNWTSITTLAASGQGVIPAQYNVVQLKVTVAGVLGDTTELFLSGKVL